MDTARREKQGRARTTCRRTSIMNKSNTIEVKMILDIRGENRSQHNNIEGTERYGCDGRMSMCSYNVHGGGEHAILKVEQ